jgi:hypothetical protein
VQHIYSKQGENMKYSDNPRTNAIALKIVFTAYYCNMSIAKVMVISTALEVETFNEVAEIAYELHYNLFGGK